MFDISIRVFRHALFEEFHFIVLCKESLSMKALSLKSVHEMVKGSSGAALRIVILLLAFSSSLLTRSCCLIGFLDGQKEFEL